MNFFERQHRARGTTLRLVFLFASAVVSIVAVIDVVLLWLYRSSPTSDLVGILVVATALTLLVILGGTVSKTIALRAGGAAVAQSVGAVAVDPATSDPRLRRFVNIVEEMSIASGVPVPRLFVLEREPGINAFAAGYSPADAAITATAGALDTLNRDELQGVIGHEFSHVLNGDMRLNVRLIGLLNGILLLGLIGLRFLAFGGGRSRDSKGNPLLIVAIALMILGFVGQFFAGLIKAAVSRQREWLADASAVQFTRQTTGLAGALKKIGGLAEGSDLKDSVGEKQVSHMLFGEGRRGISQLYATHPPLMDRIQALEPGFDPQQLAALQQQWSGQHPDGLAEDAALGFADAGPVGAGRGAAGPGAAPERRPTPAATTTRIDPSSVSARVATMTSDDVARGARLSARIPDQLRDLATQGSTAIPLVLAMLVDTRADVRDRQLQAVASRLGRRTADTVIALEPLVGPLDPVLRLPLAAVAAPQLAARPESERYALVDTLHDVGRADGAITVLEYCLTRVVGSYLIDNDDPVRRSRRGRTSLTAARDASLTLLAVVAAAGNADPAAAARAFAAAVARLYPGVDVPFVPPREPWAALDAGWEVLTNVDPRAKQALVEAVVAAVADDGVVTAAEAELLRTSCAMLRCPLPPLVA